MKKLLMIIGCCVATATAVAQSSLVDSLGDYEARFTKLNKAYAKSPDDVEASSTWRSSISTTPIPCATCPWP